MNHKALIIIGAIIGVAMLANYLVLRWHKKNPDKKGLYWVGKELVKMYSNSDSYFSKKRIESGVAFVVAQWGLVHWLVIQLASDTCKITSSDIAIWAGLEFTICGYVINQIQKEKASDEGKV